MASVPCFCAYLSIDGYRNSASRLEDGTTIAYLSAPYWLRMVLTRPRR